MDSARDGALHPIWRHEPSPVVADLLRLRLIELLVEQSTVLPSMRSGQKLPKINSSTAAEAGGRRRRRITCAGQVV